jgi:hypothetical protein
MAEETYLAPARAADDDDDATKEELQRRMEQARETITQTVTEIKDTVTNQYQSVKESISETLDWREQYRKRPVAWSVGALSVGFLTGYCIAGAIKGESRREGYPDYAESDVWNVGAPLAAGQAAGARGRTESAPTRSYASQAITGGAYGSTEYAQDDEDEAESRTADYSQGLAGDDAGGEQAEASEPSGPSLFERFKETKAFDRLQDEVSKLGDRFIEQLATVGQEVVLPALFGKIKALVGVDLSGQKQQGQVPSGRTQATGGSSSNSSSASSPSSSLADASRGSQAQAAAVGDMGGLSYGTSENRPYGGADAPRDDYGRSTAAGSGAGDTRK